MSGAYVMKEFVDEGVTVMNIVEKIQVLLIAALSILPGMFFGHFIDHYTNIRFSPFSGFLISMILFGLLLWVHQLVTRED